MEVGTLVKVIRDFLTLKEGELSVVKNDVLQVLEETDRLWIKCQNARDQGQVPKSHLHPMEVNLQRPERGSIVVCESDFNGETEGDLTINKGDILIALEAIEGGSWSRGRNLEGQVGIFPTAFCWTIDMDLLVQNQRNVKVEKFAQVVHSMQALLDEEMDLTNGEIIKITQIIDKDWYRGQAHDGKTGIFPASFVRIIDAFPGDTPPDSADLSSYLKQPKRSAADYMNTRNAFHGLDENLQALVPTMSSTPTLKFESKKSSMMGSRSKSLLEEDDYFKANLPPTYDMQPQKPPQGLSEEESTVLGLMNDKCSRGYENMVKDLSKAASITTTVEEPTTNLVTPYRYQTITFENLGYSGANVDVRPYGIAKYPFVAEFDNELSLNEGDMLYLTRYVDKEWMEAEFDSTRRGLVPISYINIIVDLMNVQHETAVTVHQNLEPDTYHKVLYTFQGVMEGDLSVVEGEVVRICEKQNEDWYVVENSSGEAGLFPGNHIHPDTEFSGKAMFDIERLLSHKHEHFDSKGQLQQNEGQNKGRQDQSWKFFDPLASPAADEEMLQLEAVLQEKAKKAQQGLVIEQRPDIIASTERKSRPPKDINSLINNNLMKLRSLSPNTKADAKANDGSNLTYDRLDVSKSVLFEMKGKNKPRKPAAPPPPTAPPMAPPPRPPSPKARKKLPERPPAPKVDLLDVNYEEKPKEPLYASVKKEINYFLRPERPPPPNVQKPMELEVKAEIDIHHYDNTPTNDNSEALLLKKACDLDDDDEASKATEDDLESLYPSVPLRTSSILPRPAIVPKGETFRSYINLKDLDPPAQFPPDKNSPMTPPPQESTPPPAGKPPRLMPSSQTRSASVASSIKSKLYASVASDRGDSPWCSSLNHSYETLNMPDSGSDVDPTATPQKNPHRPAPPVPAPGSSSPKAKKPLEEHQDEDAIEVESLYSKSQTSRRKAKHPLSRRTLRQRKIHSLKRQIVIKEKMLEEQLLKELDFYQEIAVSKGQEYDRLNQKMDRCQENIETLSDEIQRCQACLADEELQAEEESIEELRRKAEEERFRAQLEAQRREEERHREEERRRKNKEQRENVIGELIMTEREFCRDLKLTWQAFGLETPDLLEQRGIEVQGLFGNLSDIIEISSKFLENLTEDPENIGKNFCNHSESMKKVYTDYCINHDKAEQLLEKYEAIPDVQKLLQKSVETLQAQVVCFNMGSILIKPVQRILKYPLILNELLKCTEKDHEDRENLLEAVNIMTDVAAFINESKRRKDIVDKYKTEEEKTLTRKISKLNMHSIGKKSSRIGQRFLSSIGIETSIKDCDFDDLEKRYSHLTRIIQLFASDSQNFRKQFHDTVICQFNVAQNVADLYRERVHTREVERFRVAHQNILATHWNEFNAYVDKRVIKPLQQLLETFQGPTRLITKRQDKHLDFSACAQRAEKNKDPTKNKSFQDEVEKCKATYEALNSQLIEELPTLIEVATSIFLAVISEFILARKLFVGRITKELLTLMDLPLLASTSGDILEVFLVKHSLVCNQLGRFSFSSKTFKPEDKQKRNLSPTGQHIGQPDIVPQTAGLRTFLRGKYASAKLFQSNQLYTPTDALDIAINPGDLVGVIQKKDPMGNTKRWFVDNGLTQGFLPAEILNPIGDDLPLVIQPHSYDDVAEEPKVEEKVVVEQKAANPPLKKQIPVRKAPPVPGQPVVKNLLHPTDQQSNHSYEEIAASEVASEFSQDLSPIYEEIHGCSRSSVSSASSGGARSNAGSTSNSSTTSSSSDKGKFFYSLYDFEATDETMLSTKRGQVVRVIHSSNNEWCYVEDRHNGKGYVPTAYLKAYQQAPEVLEKVQEESSVKQDQVVDKQT